MASSIPAIRPLGCLKSVFRDVRRTQIISQRSYQTLNAAARAQAGLPKNLPEQFWSQLPEAMRPGTPTKRIKAYPSPPSTRAVCKDPIADITASQLSLLDPTGARSTLFARRNPDAAKVGDILLCTFKTGDPFAGVCLNIRQRGVDTAILLRNELTRVGVEMWVKVYSPNVQGIEVVQRSEKRKRRARLYYMRKPKHDRGSIQNILYQYTREKAALTGGNKKKGENAFRKKGRR